MKIIGLILLIAILIYGAYYCLPIKRRLVEKLDKEFSREKIKELAAMGDSDAVKIMKIEKIITALLLIVIVFLFFF